MRIGIDISVLNDKNRTGIGVYTFELIKNLLKTNEQSSSSSKKDKFILFGIATLSTYEYLKNLEFKDYPNVEMKVYKMPAKFFRTAFLTWQKLNWPPIETFIGPVDIFHSFNWFMPPQRHGKRVATVFDLTSVLFPQWHDPKTTQLDKARFNRIAKNADLVIAISESTKKDFMEFKPKGRVEVIYPAVRDGLGKRGKEKETLEKYGLKPGYLLAVGTLEPRKNLENLVKAYLESKISEPLILVGKSGWKNEGLMDLINKHQDRIKQLGFVPDEELANLYKHALIFVYPSFYEGFGIPVLEAMKAGLPVITSNISSLPEVGGKAARYIDPSNTKEIGNEIKKIIGDIRIRRRMGQMGMKQAEKFSWEKSAQELNKLYQEITA